jgi:hypothetical protein
MAGSRRRRRRLLRPNLTKNKTFNTYPTLFLLLNPNLTPKFPKLLPNGRIGGQSVGKKSLFSPILFRSSSSFSFFYFCFRIFPLCVGWMVLDLVRKRSVMLMMVMVEIVSMFLLVVMFGLFLDLWM